MVLKFVIIRWRFWLLRGFNVAVFISLCANTPLPPLINRGFRHGWCTRILYKIRNTHLRHQTTATGVCQLHTVVDEEGCRRTGGVSPEIEAQTSGNLVVLCISLSLSLYIYICVSIFLVSQILSKKRSLLHMRCWHRLLLSPLMFFKLFG